MKLRHRRLISIITSFIMAVTVFGCTSLTFAADEDDAIQAADNETPVATETEGTSENEQQPVLREGAEGNPDEEVGENENEEPEPEGPVAIDAPTLTATADGMKITLKWTLPEPKNEGTISFELSSDPALELVPEEGATELTKEDAAGTYTFTIKAIEKDADENEIVSSEATATVTATDFTKQKLTGLRSDPGYRAVLLEWNPVEGATGYLIFRRRGEERGNVDSNCIDSDIP